jgi:hypothetical protein
MKRTLLAAAVLAAWPLAPATAHADGPCTTKTNPNAYHVCSGLNDAQCGGIGMWGVSHSTCTYPDGSRDECDWHITSLTSSTGGCTWFPTAPAFPLGPPQETH